MNPNDEILLKTITLEWQKYGLAQQVSAEFLTNIDIDIHRHMLFDTLLIRLTKMLLTDTLARDSYSADLRVPASWWQHWKEQHGRTWLGPLIMQRWPVRYDVRTAVVEVHRFLGYPEAKIARDPGNLGPVRIMENVQGPYWPMGPR